MEPVSTVVLIVIYEYCTRFSYWYTKFMTRDKRKTGAAVYRRPRAALLSIQISMGYYNAAVGFSYYFFHLSP